MKGQGKELAVHHAFAFFSCSWSSCGETWQWDLEIVGEKCRFPSSSQDRWGVCTETVWIVAEPVHLNALLTLFLLFKVGIVNVALVAPSVEGSYTSHWRLAHAGEQFGPRVWCSIVVDPQAPAPVMADGILVSPCVTPQVSPVVW